MSSRVSVPHKSRAQSCAEIFLIESPLLVILMLRATFLWIATWGRQDESLIILTRVETYADRILKHRSPFMNVLAFLGIAIWELAQTTGLAVIAGGIVLLKLCTVPVLVLTGLWRLRGKRIGSQHAHAAHAPDHADHHGHGHAHAHGHGHHQNSAWFHIGVLVVCILALVFIYWIGFMITGIVSHILGIPYSYSWGLLIPAGITVVVLLALMAGGSGGGGGGKKAGGGGHGHGGGHH